MKDDGPINYETADIMPAIGNAYTALKNHNLALQYYYEAFEIQAKLFEECSTELDSISKTIHEKNRIDIRDYSDSLLAHTQN
ncbi:unnamed protein product [Didymodactylos carnosus]|uniref:Tetratricopeptide repeat protein n=1 Tax=Didymodactylos carnosus TaxID=1234261 RepID=A0A8S2U8S4_9BILA|nr:unnamed protein product [Didymodactylos carnosus]CAF4330554.1 unnamed protein product [Didymodactylos carnosus]